VGCVGETFLSTCCLLLNSTTTTATAATATAAISGDFDLNVSNSSVTMRRRYADALVHIGLPENNVNHIPTNITTPKTCLHTRDLL